MTEIKWKEVITFYYQIKRQFLAWIYFSKVIRDCLWSNPAESIILKDEHLRKQSIIMTWSVRISIGIYLQSFSSFLLSRTNLLRTRRDSLIYFPIGSDKVARDIESNSISRALSIIDWIKWDISHSCCFLSTFLLSIEDEACKMINWTRKILSVESSSRE